jgi:hypothetical protein
MKSWKQGARLDEKCPFGDLLNAARNAQTVQFSGAKSFQNQEIECAL